MTTATATAGRIRTPWRIEDCVLPLDSSLDVTMTVAKMYAVSKDAEWQKDEIIRCRLDPWYWRINYVVTVNEHWVEEGWSGPYRRWPSSVHSRSYAHVLFTELQTAWPKSRQRMATWLVGTQMLGDALFTGGRLYMIQSKREKDAVKVLGRIRGVYERMRQMAPWLVPELAKDDAGEIGWSNGSTMMAVPEGATYVQSHTPAWWFADELQLQAEAKEAFRAALPACERISLVGTPDYGWFYQSFLRDKEAA